MTPSITDIRYSGHKMTSQGVCYNESWLYVAKNNGSCIKEKKKHALGTKLNTTYAMQK